MAVNFLIEWRNEQVQVSGGQGEEYFEITFEDGDKRLIEDTHYGWRFVRDHIEWDMSSEEMTPEESAREIGLIYEAEAIGKLIYEKARELGLEL